MRHDSIGRVIKVSAIATAAEERSGALVTNGAPPYDKRLPYVAHDRAVYRDFRTRSIGVPCLAIIDGLFAGNNVVNEGGLCGSAIRDISFRKHRVGISVAAVLPFRDAVRVRLELAGIARRVEPAEHAVRRDVRPVRRSDRRIVREHHPAAADFERCGRRQHLLDLKCAVARLHDVRAAGDTRAKAKRPDLRRVARLHIDLRGSVSDNDGIHVVRLRRRPRKPLALQILDRLPPFRVRQFRLVDDCLRHCKATALRPVVLACRAERVKIRTCAILEIYGNHMEFGRLPPRNRLHRRGIQTCSNVRFAVEPRTIVSFALCV